MRREMFIKNLRRLIVILMVTGSSKAKENKTRRLYCRKKFLFFILERKFALLMASLILISAFYINLAPGQDEFGQDEKDALDNYLREVPFHRELKTQEKMEKMNWIGSFTEAEKKELIEFLDKQTGYLVASWSTVIKGDLNKDGQMEYIVEDLLIADPKPSSFGTQLAVVNKVKKSFNLIIVSPPTKGRTFGRKVRIDLLDFDKNGQSDIIVQEYNFDQDPEDPKPDLYYTAIYRNKNMKFDQIYERDHNYDEVKFKDLDNDEILEILETVNDLPYETYQQHPKWRWMNIYRWNGTKLEQVNNKFLSFYLEQEKLYKSLLQEASAKASEYRKKGKKTIWDTTERTMKEYLDRIEKMKRSGEQKSK